MPAELWGNKAKRRLFPPGCVSLRLISSKWFTYFVMRPVYSAVTIPPKYVREEQSVLWEGTPTHTVPAGLPRLGLRRGGRQPEIDQLSNVHMTKSHPNTKKREIEQIFAPANIEQHSAQVLPFLIIKWIFVLLTECEKMCNMKIVPPSCWWCWIKFKCWPQIEAPPTSHRRRCRLEFQK